MSRIITQYDMASAMQVRGANTYSPYLWDGLQLWMPFLRGKNDPRDWSGHGNHGTRVSVPMWERGTGVWPLSMKFDGTDDYLTIANGSNFDFERTDKFTIHCRMRTPSIGDGAVHLISKQVNSGNYEGWTTRIVSGMFEATMINDGSPSNQSVVRTTASSFDDDQWYDITWTNDGTGTASGIIIYVDGVVEPSFVAADTLSASIKNNVAVTVGARESGGQPFGGHLCDVRVFSRLLSSSEALEISQQPWRAATPRPTQAYFNHTAPPVQTAKTPIPLLTGVH